MKSLEHVTCSFTIKNFPVRTEFERNRDKRSSHNFAGTLVQTILVFLLAVAVSGQEIPKPEQIDLFGKVSCDELGARSQNFANQISVNPNSRGIVFANPVKGQVNFTERQFRQILAHFAYYNVEDRLELVLVPGGGKQKWEFWMVPAGAEEPDLTGEKWNLPSPDVTKPFIYDYEDEIGICSTFVTRKFAEMLNKNPGSRAHIVVKRGTPHRYSSRGFADQWVNELTTRYSIGKDRIRVFYVRGDSPSTYTEFWFVPAKKKKK